jgi:hypothetical protein
MDKNKVNKLALSGLFGLAVLILLGSFALKYFGTRQNSPNPEPSPTVQPAESLMSEQEARAIAEQSCIKGGEALTSGGTYNANSKTWWFDANLNSTQQGCHPACVVWAETKTAEINWRCTGLIVPEQSAGEALRQIFAQKYPQYSETLSVRTDMETQNHVRGGIAFVPGEPGGIFLAAKINGQWQIIHEGNGQISCSLSSYGFPGEMLADCAN